MSYVQPINSRKGGRFPFIVKIVLFLAIALFLLRIIAPQAVSSFFTVLVRPLWSIDAHTTAQDKMIDELKRTLAINQARDSQSASLQKENEDLKALLGRSASLHPLLATILKKPPFSAYDTFILDVGKQDGIENGDKVYALGNIPIGEIAETLAATSKVRLYSSAGQRFDVFVGNSSIEATAFGKGGGYFETTLPRDAKISKGDPVSIPSLTNAFAGTVEAIVSDPSEPFSTVLFHQPVNIYELRWVLVNLKR